MLFDVLWWCWWSRMMISFDVLLFFRYSFIAYFAWYDDDLMFMMCLMLDSACSLFCSCLMICLILIMLILPDALMFLIWCFLIFFVRLIFRYFIPFDSPMPLTILMLFRLFWLCSLLIIISIWWYTARVRYYYFDWFIISIIHCLMLIWCWCFDIFRWYYYFWLRVYLMLFWCSISPDILILILLFCSCLTMLFYFVDDDSLMPWCSVICSWWRVRSWCLMPYLLSDVFDDYYLMSFHFRYYFSPDFDMPYFDFPLSHLMPDMFFFDVIDPDACFDTIFLPSLLFIFVHSIHYFDDLRSFDLFIIIRSLLIRLIIIHIFRWCRCLSIFHYRRSRHYFILPAFDYDYCLFRYFIISLFIILSFRLLRLHYYYFSFIHFHYCH